MSGPAGAILEIIASERHGHFRHDRGPGDSVSCSVRRPARDGMDRDTVADVHRARRPTTEGAAPSLHVTALAVHSAPGSEERRVESVR